MKQFAQWLIFYRKKSLKIIKEINDKDLDDDSEEDKENIQETSVTNNQSKSTLEINFD
jgi:hypothetical protein